MIFTAHTHLFISPCTTLYGVHWAFGCLWERTLLSLGCSDVCGSVHGCLWAVRFSTGNVRLTLGPYMVVFGPYGLRWVRARYTTGRTVVIGSVHSSLWDIRWSVGPYAVVFWAYGVYRAVTPDSGTVHGCRWAVRLTMGPYALYSWAHGGNWVRTQ